MIKIFHHLCNHRRAWERTWGHLVLVEAGLERHDRVGRVQRVRVCNNAAGDWAPLLVADAPRYDKRGGPRRTPIFHR